MSVISKIRKMFGGEEEVASTNVDLLKSEVNDLILQLDSLHTHYSELMDSTTDSIEKSEESEFLTDRIEYRYKDKRDALLKSLGAKKAELRNALEKGEPTKQYADSIVRDNQGRILMLLRSSNESYAPNKWCLAGGKVEKGEAMPVIRKSAINDYMIAKLNGKFQPTGNKFETGTNNIIQENATPSMTSEQMTKAIERANIFVKVEDITKKVAKKVEVTDNAKI